VGIHLVGVAFLVVGLVVGSSLLEEEPHTPAEGIQVHLEAGRILAEADRNSLGWTCFLRVWIWMVKCDEVAELRTASCLVVDV